jgi:hypothetical protein
VLVINRKSGTFPSLFNLAAAILLRRRDDVPVLVTIPLGSLSRYRYEYSSRLIYCTMLKLLAMFIEIGISNELSRLLFLPRSERCRYIEYV